MVSSAAAQSVRMIEAELAKRKEQCADKTLHDIIKGFIYVTTLLILNAFSIAEIILDSLGFPCL